MRKIRLLLGAELLLSALAGNVAHAGNFNVDVHVNNVTMTEPQQDALIALLRQNGVKTVRTGIGGKFNHFIISAYRVGIGALASVSPTVASKARCANPSGPP